MAIEEIFIGSSITVLTATITFLVLYLNSRDDLIRHLWLFLTFVMLVYGVTIDRFGFTRVAVINDFDDLTAQMMNLMNWLMILTMFYLGLVLLINIINLLWGFMTGRKAYGKTDKPAQNPFSKD